MERKQIGLKELVKAEVHCGHPTRKWNPKMAPYLYNTKDGNHILDSVQTLIYLRAVSRHLRYLAFKGKTFLFIGSKKQAAFLISKYAFLSRSCFVNERWLGGMLTNWRTMKTSIAKLNQFLHPKWEKRIKRLSKKEGAILNKEKDRLEKYVGGLREMREIPDVAIIVGQLQEMNAVCECKKVGIQNVTILDSNCDPRLADLFIPANDDSFTSLELILSTLSNAILAGRKLHKDASRKRNQLKN